MRTSRRSVWAVGLLLGMSGCAGVQQRGPVAAPGGVLAEAPAPSGFRGWWGRRFGAGYQPAVQSGLGSIPPAAAFPGASGGGWGSVYQFSRPPWVTRQPQRAPIFSMNPSGVPAGAKMSPAEINEAIARMSAGRRDDDQVLPVRNVDEPRVATEDVDREEPSILARPIRLPEALADASGDETPGLDDRRQATAPTGTAGAPRTPEAGETVAAQTPEADPAPEADPLRADPIDDPEPVATPLAMTNALEATLREVQDERLVRSSQLPPPPPIRPEPGVEPPVADPAPPPPLDAPRPEEAPKPADVPKVEDAPKPVDVPKPAEPPRLEEAPKVEEAPKPAETPKAEEAPKPVVTSRPAEAPKVQDVMPEPDDLTPPPVRDARPAEQAPTAVPTVMATPAPQAQGMPPVPAAQAQTQTYPAPVVSAFPNPEPRAHRWSFWNWKSSGHDHGHQAHARASGQSPSAQLPPATFPTSYESVWAKPLVPCPEEARMPLASTQATTVAPSPQAVPTAAEKAPCWLVDRLKTRAHQLKVWKHEHLCKHIQGFKAAFKGGKCRDCEKVVTPSPQAGPRPTPQAVPSPQAKPSPQELPVIGGSRFGLY